MDGLLANQVRKHSIHEGEYELAPDSPSLNQSRMDLVRASLQSSRRRAAAAVRGNDAARDAAAMS